ncbi:hypothetical protein ACFFTM_08445 [Pseudoduganella plicata]|uniref:Uncharacterized protein n=1 Tax=Pseudoduganella plicata TaxID=321984 RepID=A0A4P7BDB9_9BURK|nr:hypothetical protein [Pseudoduganella plicata]QBQ35485.1 hypothetical protein E1742_04370 [Pseudoduganella plicata]GGZ02131.1 hypothetical protein GCM10007388_39900 [Pseudoduganella plicata]
MDNLEQHVEDFLFGTGLQLGDYYIERTPFSEMLCYRNAEGREFDLPISNEELATAVFTRLKALNVRIVNLG